MPINNSEVTLRRPQILEPPCSRCDVFFRLDMQMVRLASTLVLLFIDPTLVQVCQNPGLTVVHAAQSYLRPGNVTVTNLILPFLLLDHDGGHLAVSDGPFPSNIFHNLCIQLSAERSLWRFTRRSTSCLILSAAMP